MSIAACRAFFDAWNRRDFDTAISHVAPDCLYNDFSFLRPHNGAAEVRALLENVAKVAPGVTFLIRDITGGHPGENSVGAYWEILNDGRPTGRMGVSFYRYDESDRLVWALDAADPGPQHRTHDFH